MSFIYQLSFAFSCVIFSLFLSLNATQMDAIYLQVQTSAQKVQAAVDDIKSTPSEEQTYENTLRKWDSISQEIQNTFAFLNAQMQTDFADKDLVLNLIREYQTFINTIFIDQAELYSPLFFYAKKALMEDNLRTPLERDLAHLIGVNCLQFKDQMFYEDQEILEFLVRLKSKAEKTLKHRISTILSQGDSIDLCGEVSGGAKADTSGNSSADISVSGKSDDGKFSGRVTGEISRDSDGRVSGSIEARGTYEFNR